jgi:hypothetical protein
MSIKELPRSFAWESCVSRPCELPFSHRCHCGPFSSRLPVTKEFVMSRQPLPLVDPARTEFSFARTVCACHECTLSCHHIPGYLIPADLERIHQHLSPCDDPEAWDRAHLLASPGALVLCRGQMARILTLVPARRPDGACTFLTEAGQCAIHALAPFGCAFIDAHQPKEEADRRSSRGLQSVIAAWNASAPYARLWVTLARAGLVAPEPEVARRQLERALNENDQGSTDSRRDTP